MFTQFIGGVFNRVSSVSFDTLILIIWGSFAGLFLIVLFACFFSRKIKAASKRPYFCLCNAYSAVTLSAYLTSVNLAQSVFAAVLFWCAAYLSYGLLCALTKPVEKPRDTGVVLSALPVAVPPVKKARIDVPAAKSSVRLEHAISVTERLLEKNLGKGDRQELEKLKNTLAVLQMKGTLSPAESDILNENFNALLKLMAKYNI